MQLPLPSKMLPIEKWKAFKGKYPPNSNNEHRIIIIYKHDCNIKYFYVTSQVEKARLMARNDIGSLVDGIDSGDWDVLTKESCIQCNESHLCEISDEELRKAWDQERLKPLGTIPNKIKQKIISAICASKTFTDTQKKIYTMD